MNEKIFFLSLRVVRLNTDDMRDYTDITPRLLSIKTGNERVDEKSETFD